MTPRQIWKSTYAQAREHLGLHPGADLYLKCNGRKIWFKDRMPATPDCPPIRFIEPYEWSSKHATANRAAGFAALNYHRDYDDLNINHVSFFFAKSRKCGFKLP